jgi:integrase
MCKSLRPLPITAIDTSILIKVLESAWLTKRETASRVRNRIEQVLDYAIASGFRTGDNPARLALLGKVLPAGAGKAEHFAAVPYVELPGVMTQLRAQQGTAARALEFLILTATRTAEVMGARWPEVNLAEAVWAIPAERMKNGREHRIPLSAAALKLLSNLHREADNDFVFVGARKGRGIGNTSALSTVLRSLDRTETVHGMRSALADWAHEKTGASHLVVELSLAHAVGSAVERSYRRTDLFAQRRSLMDQWGRFLTSPPVAGEVVPIRGRKR